jgi:hypothetical protein
MSLNYYVLYFCVDNMDELITEQLMELFNDDDESWFFENHENYVFEEINSSITTLTNEKNDQTYSNLYSSYEYVMSILNDNPSKPYNHFRMNKNKFLALCQEVVAKRIVKTEEVKIEEQVGMFLHIIGHASNMRTIGTNFRRSIDTVHKTFNDVLWSIIEMRADYIKLPSMDAPRHACVAADTSFFPF